MLTSLHPWWLTSFPCCSCCKKPCLKYFPKPSCLQTREEKLSNTRMSIHKNSVDARNSKNSRLLPDDSINFIYSFAESQSSITSNQPFNWTVRESARCRWLWNRTQGKWSPKCYQPAINFIAMISLHSCLLWNWYYLSMIHRPPSVDIMWWHTRIDNAKQQTLWFYQRRLHAHQRRQCSCTSRRSIKNAREWLKHRKPCPQPLELHKHN